jgi:nucleotide-binding universal stress UspA family protein
MKKGQSNLGEFEPTTILVPIDFSRRCVEALPWLRFLAPTIGATIHLVHVHGMEYPLPMDVGLPDVRRRAEIEKRLLRYLQKFGARYRLAAHSVRCHVRTGNAQNEICSLARKIDADLIIASTHGHTGWKPEHLTVPRGALVYATPELKQRAVDDARAGLKKFAAKIDFEGVAWKKWCARTFRTSGFAASRTRARAIS